MIQNKLNDFYYGAALIPGQQFSLISISGPDSEDYLQRQLTNDVLKLSDGFGQLNARLDRTGRIHSFFYLGKKSSEQFYIVCESGMAEKVREELDKFIIMEDIELKLLSDEISLLAGPVTVDEDVLFQASWCHTVARFIKGKVSGNYSEMDESHAQTLKLATAWPETGLTLNGDEIVNETILNNLAVCYKKGCFLGQETAGKIESRRGAAKFPTVVETNSFLNKESIEIEEFPKAIIWGSFQFEEKSYFLTSLPREGRVEGRTLKVNNEEATVVGLELVKKLSPKEFAEKIYFKAVELYHAKEVDKAIRLLDTAINIDPSYADAYESKGAILGQLEKYDAAISVMDDLLEVDKNSIMAHTNKSLFFMKQGKIEEAEEEKALATVANFQRLGEEAKAKKAIEAEENKKKAEVERREKMFRQVIDMDAKDEIANYGLADILFSREEFSEAKKHLEIVLEGNPKYSVAYLLIGKVLEKLDQINEAKSFYDKGIEVATKQGDMMPANEMQSRLNKLA